MSAEQYPPEFRKLLRHVTRLSKALMQLERSDPSGSWLVGRSGELRAVVSSTIADWRAGALDHEAALRAITSYIDSLHRGAQARSGGALGCCTTDDAITVVPGEALALSAPGDAAELEAPTARVKWVDSPEVMERFRSELERVEIEARMLSRRLGNKSVTRDDLRGFGREGLLAAARSFDESHGAPFAKWAGIRIRNAMIDGVRRWGQLPRRVQRELRALEALDAVQRAHEEQPQPKTAEGADQALAKRLGAMATAMALVRAEPEEAVVDLGASPEELAAKAELRNVLRDVVAKLPPQERKVLEGYHFAGKSLKEAGAAVGVSESRACRLLAQAMEFVHQELVKYGGVAVSETRQARKP